jgi:hypothetical protein
MQLFLLQVHYRIFGIYHSLMQLSVTDSPVISTPPADAKQASVRRADMREERWQRSHTTDLFFADTALIGIVTGHPGPRFCWLLNQHLRTSFVNVPADTIHMIVDKEGKKVTERRSIKASVPSLFMPAPEEEMPTAGKQVKSEYFFPVYCHSIPDSSFRYLLYKLRSGAVSLLSASKNHGYDYLLLVQTAYPQHDTHMILDVMRSIPEIQLAQELSLSDIEKSKENLVL